MLKKFAVLLFLTMLLCLSPISVSAFDLAKDDVVCTSRTKALSFFLAVCNLDMGKAEAAGEYYNFSFKQQSSLDKDICTTINPENIKAKVLPGSFQWTIGEYKGREFHVVQIMIHGTDGGSQFFYIIRELTTNIEKEEVPVRNPDSDSDKKQENDVPDVNKERDKKNT